MLRQDPNVVMVGEIRDRETAAIAMQVAQTGHLVLSSLHTNTAPGAITRLRDLGIPSNLIASSVGSIVAQRLVRKICSCAVPAEAEMVKRCAAMGIATPNVKEARQCERCHQTGYHGRIGIFSFLEVTQPIVDAIRDEKGEAEIVRLAYENGFVTLEEAGMRLVEAGLTSIEELERCLGAIELKQPYRTAGAARLDGEAGKESGIAKRRVLLVEDEENTRVVLSMLLQREHFEVIEAANGVEALECVYRCAPEIIVSDLMMPKMSGFEFIQRLKNDSRTRNIPVLVLTAADDERNELNLIGTGADDFVSKTSDTKIMIARLHRLLERTR